MKRKFYTDLDDKRISRVEANAQIEALIQRKDRNGERYSEKEKAFIGQYSGDGGLGRKNSRDAGVLYEYYTPDWLCERMWELAGFKGGKVLDPAVGTGNFIKGSTSDFTGFEINPVSFRISEILYP